MFDTVSYNYYYNVLDIDKDTTEAGTDLQRFVLGAGYEVTVELNFPVPLVAKEGFDTKVKLRIDHAKWFDGVLLDGDLSQNLDHIKENTPFVFSLE